MNKKYLAIGVVATAIIIFGFFQLHKNQLVSKFGVDNSLALAQVSTTMIDPINVTTVCASTGSGVNHGNTTPAIPNSAYIQSVTLVQNTSINLWVGASDLPAGMVDKEPLLQIVGADNKNLYSHYRQDIHRMIFTLCGSPASTTPVQMTVNVGWMRAGTTTAVASICPSGTKIGDINADGKIDAIDAQLLAIYATDSTFIQKYPCADTNKDGVFNAVDAQTLTNAISGNTGVIATSTTPTTLKSNFLKNDPTAQSIMTGQTPDYNITTVLPTLSPFSTTNFAYRFISALRMLGYKASFGGSLNMAVVFLNNFEKANGYQILPYITKPILIDVDNQLAKIEIRDLSMANNFPLYKYYINSPINEPPKEHSAALFYTAFKNLPSSLVTWNEQGFVDFLSRQQPARIKFQPESTNYVVCDPTMYQETRDTCQLSPNITQVYSYSNDFDDAAEALLHEYAHYLDGNIFTKTAGLSRGIIDTTGFYAISYDLSSLKVNPNGWKFYTYKNPANVKNEFVSAYAMGWKYNSTTYSNYWTAQEDFAESFAMYITAGKAFRELGMTNPVLQQKYDWLKQNVFGGKEYSTGVDNALTIIKNNPNHLSQPQVSTGIFNVEEYSLAVPGFVWNFGF